MTVGWMPVVAGALRSADGRWLMHQRPAGKHHAGLWEFPGGKVEPDETPVEALVRELCEELGIGCNPAACIPTCFAEATAAQAGRAIVILLYTITRWNGNPAALEGGKIGWFTPDEVRALAKPPLDVILTGQLLQNR